MSDAIDDRLVNVLGALAVAIADRVRTATEDASGMTGAAPVALIALEQFLGGRTTEELAQAVGITHSGAVRLVDRLVRSGLVERRPGRDRRSLAIVLTGSGRTLSRTLTAARAEAIRSLVESLGDGDRRALLPSLDAMVAAVTEQRLAARSRGDAPTGWLCRLCDFDACERPEGRCPAQRTAQMIAADD